MDRNNSEKNKKTSIFLIGDSLMADYPKDGYFPQQGWGKYFSEYFNKDKANVYNTARGGESTSSFMKNPELFEEKVLKRITKGDVAVISLCHNDQFSKRTLAKKGEKFVYISDDEHCGLEIKKSTGDIPRRIDGLTPVCTVGCDVKKYKENLSFLAGKIKEKNAFAVFVTEPNTGERMYTRDDYAEAMVDVAKEKNCDFFDLYTFHNQYIESYFESSFVAEHAITKVPLFVQEQMFLYKLKERGIISAEEQKTHLNQNIRKTGSDLVHLSGNGAELVAKCVAGHLKDSVFGSLLLKKNIL